MADTNTTAAERVEKLRRMIAETNRDCLMSSWLELLDTAQAVATDHTAQAAEIAELRAKLEAAEKSFTEFDDDGVPDYATPAYEVFNAGISFAVAQLQKVLGVKEWSTSGGGTETLDGDLRSELYDLLKAAGFTSDDKTIEQVAAELTELRAAAQACDDERPVDAPECYYVQNVSAGYVGNNPQFWGKGGNGYTSYIDNAERFTAADALALLREDSRKWRVWSSKDVTGCVYRTVESQQLNRLKPVTAETLAGLGVAK